MFAAIYIPDFPLQAGLRAEPELRDHAVAVIDGQPPVLTVIASNEKARHAGVCPGMTALQASTAVAELRLRRRSPAREAAAHAALLDCAQSFSPRVEDTAADTVVLDLSGLGLLFGSPAKIARDLARRASELGLESNVAVASNPDAAMYAARGFSGVTVILPGTEAERLGELSIEVLAGTASSHEEDPQEILEILDRWGVRTFRALAALPEIALTERLGQRGLRWQRLAHGSTQRILVPAEPQLHFQEAVELEYPVASLEPLALILAPLLEQLCARLGARALATNKLWLTCELEASSSAGQAHAHGSSFSLARGDLRTPVTEKKEAGNGKPVFARTLGLPVPMLDSRIFLKLLQLDLETHPPQAPVVTVTVGAEPVLPRRSQSGLFLAAEPEPERLELTLARIAAVLHPRVAIGDGKAEPPAGERPAFERVGSAELLDTHRPDAFCMRRFLPPATAATTNLRKPPSEAAPAISAPAMREMRKPRLALRRFRPPLAATVELHGRQPLRLWTQRLEIRGQVLACSGPWHASGEWWDELWERDEWDISIGDAAAVVLCRIYYDRITARWYVEGTYD